MLIAFGLLTFLVSWVTLYTFNPTFVRVVCKEDIFARTDTPPDPVKCYLLSVLIASVATVLWWGVFREYRIVPLLIPSVKSAAPEGAVETNCAIV